MPVLCPGWWPRIWSSCRARHPDLGLFLRVPRSKKLRQSLIPLRSRGHDLEVIELKGSPGSALVGAAVAQLFQDQPRLLEACALVMSFEVPELLAFAESFRGARPRLLLCHWLENGAKRLLDLG